MRLLNVLFEHITSPILMELRRMSSNLQTQIDSLTAVVTQLQGDVSTVVSKLGSISNVSAGDTITPEQESAISSAVSALQSIHASLAQADTTTAPATGSDTVSGSTDAQPASGSDTVSGATSDQPQG